MNFFFPSLAHSFFLQVSFIKFFLLPIFLFLFGLLGLVVYRQNLLILLMAIELLLLSVNLLFSISSLWLDDITGQIFALIILTVAAAESAIGLAIIVTIFNLISVVNIFELSKIKG
jgi:NADH-quinone oxidoreductase subunit K